MNHQSLVKTAGKGIGKHNHIVQSEPPRIICPHKVTPALREVGIGNQQGTVIAAYVTDDILVSAVTQPVNNRNAITCVKLTDALASLLWQRTESHVYSKNQQGLSFCRNSTIPTMAQSFHIPVHTKRFQRRQNMYACHLILVKEVNDTEMSGYVENMSQNIILRLGALLQMRTPLPGLSSSPHRNLHNACATFPMSSLPWRAFS